MTEPSGNRLEGKRKARNSSPVGIDVPTLESINRTEKAEELDQPAKFLIQEHEDLSLEPHEKLDVSTSGCQGPCQDPCSCRSAGSVLKSEARDAIKCYTEAHCWGRSSVALLVSEGLATRAILI